MNEVNNQDYLQQTIALKKHIESYFLELGERLCTIRNNHLYSENYGTFAEFLLELKMTEGTASKLIAIYQKLIVDFNIDPAKLADVPWTSLYELLPVVTDKDGAEALIDKARHLTRGDLADEIREKKTGCVDHQFTEQSFLKCNECGKLVRKFD